MKKLLFTIITLIPLTLFSQIKWGSDYETAKLFAEETGRIIVLDFTATWCGPCAEMESNLWTSDELKPYTDKFIFVKVDIDDYPSVARSFRVQGVPTVKLITANREILWSEVGYGGGNSQYVNVLKRMPADLSIVYENDKAYDEKKPSADDIYQLALSYQQVAKGIEHRVTRSKFIELSTKFLGDIDDENKQYADAQLQKILNVVYNEGFKRAQKKLDKIDDSIKDSNKEMYAFIQGMTYKGLGDDVNCKACCQSIKSHELLNEIDHFLE